MKRFLICALFASACGAPVVEPTATTSAITTRAAAPTAGEARDDGNSNPMPGEPPAPSSPAASNPMPGAPPVDSPVDNTVGNTVDAPSDHPLAPGASNPMPGLSNVAVVDYTK